MSVIHCNTPEIYVIFLPQEAQFTGSKQLPRERGLFIPCLLLYHPYKPLRIIPELRTKYAEVSPQTSQLSPLRSHTLNIDTSGSLFLRTLKYDTPTGSSPRPMRGPCWEEALSGGEPGNQECLVGEDSGSSNSLTNHTPSL